MKRIGVIGAGAGGLCAARHILAAGNMQPIVWEQSERIGGTWVYNPNIGQDKNGQPIFSSMYKNLKTNLPKEVMSFPDYYPFPEGGKSYLSHKQVLSYLEDYCKHYQLDPHINLNHHVEKVIPLDHEGNQKWKITATDFNTSKTSTTTCDAIFVCNGQNSVPRTPFLEGIDSFKGLQVHSHDYREASPYQGMKVVVLGASSSGMDISLEIATVAQQVYLSHNLPVIPSELPSNMKQVPGITHVKEDRVVFGNGTSAEVDAIVYCTGYEYTYPFLDKSCGISVEDRQVKPLYKHVVNTNYPTMGFFGLPTLTVPLAILHYQVAFFMGCLTGKLNLPNKEAMDKDTAEEFKQLIEAGRSARHFHKIAEGQWDYIEDLTSRVGIPTIPKYKRDMFDDVMENRRVGLVGFRKLNYRLTKDYFEKYL